MTGHFKDGKWIEEPQPPGETIVDTKIQVNESALDQTLEKLKQIEELEGKKNREFQEEISKYFRQICYYYRSLSFYGRLKYLIFPERMRR